MAYTVHRTGTHTVIAYSGRVIAHGATTLEPDVIERLLRDLVEHHPEGKKRPNTKGADAKK